MSNLPLLSLLVWLPILGGALCLAVGNSRPQLARWLALVVAMAFAPSDRITAALPASQALGRISRPERCRSRKVVMAVSSFLMKVRPPSARVWRFSVTDSPSRRSMTGNPNAMSSVEMAYPMESQR